VVPPGTVVYSLHGVTLKGHSYGARGYTIPITAHPIVPVLLCRRSGALLRCPVPHRLKQALQHTTVPLGLYVIVQPQP